MLKSNLSDLSNDNLSPFVALNSAFMESGIVLRVLPNVVLKKPIEIIDLTIKTETPIMRHPRNILVIDEGAEATLIKTHLGCSAKDCFTNAVTDISVGRSGKLRLYTVQNNSQGSVHLSTTNTNIASQASFETFSFTSGGHISRSEMNVNLNGVGADCNVSGTFLMRGQEHCDTTTLIEHVAPETNSREIFKGILDDESRGVFQGKILVHKDAQRINGHQLSKTLLLSNGAEMDAKPELEIYADDVKCSHGATTGQLDETSMFYMRSRGIPEPLARELLMQSFIGDVLNEISNDNVREGILGLVLERLSSNNLAPHTEQKNEGK